jgi:hypothetical protein
MTNEVMKKETTAVAMTSSDYGETSLNSDMVIPKLLLQQGLSEYVTDRKAQMGDMVRSTTGEKLGGPEHPVRFIPLTIKNTWTNYELIETKPVYRGVEERNASNELLPFEYEKDGRKYRRVKAINVFALLPQDVKAETAELAKYKETGEIPDLDKTLLPVVISFRSTGFNAGKVVSTHFSKARSMAARVGAAPTPHHYYMDLSCFLTKNDKGSFYVFDVKAGPKISSDEMAAADLWRNVLLSRDVHVDDRDEKETDKPEGYVPMTAHGKSQF